MDKKTKMKEKKASGIWKKSVGNLSCGNHGHRDDDAGMGADRCRVERFYQSYGR